ncbi:unknown [Sinorhizobium phage PBC5]|nr:unknown [Sinorhizobium phage PBC5]
MHGRKRPSTRNQVPIAVTPRRRKVHTRLLRSRSGLMFFSNVEGLGGHAGAVAAHGARQHSADRHETADFLAVLRLLAKRVGAVLVTVLVGRFGPDAHVVVPLLAVVIEVQDALGALLLVEHVVAEILFQRRNADRHQVGSARHNVDVLEPKPLQHVFGRLDHEGTGAALVAVVREEVVAEHVSGALELSHDKGIRLAAALEVVDEVIDEADRLVKPDGDIVINT